jgi:hypothetical protein
MLLFLKNLISINTLAAWVTLYVPAKGIILTLISSPFILTPLFVTKFNKIAHIYYGELITLILIFPAIFLEYLLIKKLYIQIKERRIKKTTKPIDEINEIIKLIDLPLLYESIHIDWLAESIAQKKALSICENKYFCNDKSEYTINRFINLKPLLLEPIRCIEKICEKIAEQLSSEITTEKKILFLYNEKNQYDDNNTYFVDKLTEKFSEKCKKNKKNIQIQKLTYKEQKRTSEYLDNYELKNVNVIFCDSLFIFPHVIEDTITQLENRGALIKKIIILFDGTYNKFNSESKLDKFNDIIIGFFIDLGLLPMYKRTANSMKEINLEHKHY